MMPDKPHNPTPAERDERFTLPLDPETALRGLLAVDPDDDATACIECGKPGTNRVSLPVLSGHGNRRTTVVCDEHLADFADAPGAIVLTDDEKPAKKK